MWPAHDAWMMCLLLLSVCSSKLPAKSSRTTYYIATAALLVTEIFPLLVGVTVSSDLPSQHHRESRRNLAPPPPLLQRRYPMWPIHDMHCGCGYGVSANLLAFRHCLLNWQRMFYLELPIACVSVNLLTLSICLCDQLMMHGWCVCFCYLLALRNCLLNLVEDYIALLIIGSEIFPLMVN